MLNTRRGLPGEAEAARDGGAAAPQRGGLPLERGELDPARQHKPLGRIA